MADEFSFPGRPPSFRLGVSNAGLEDPASLDTSTSSKGGRGTVSDRVMYRLRTDEDDNVWPLVG
jgi:hypothetical protein